jgi:phosphonoacetaldehyde hydrolase
VVDFGSFAPTQIFVEAFAEFDVQVSIEEARGPMGMGKWDHIRTLCDQPQIAERYKKVFGRTPTDDDVTAIYERFMPLQIEKIAEHSALIPGALETIAQLREQGIKIGSCSGYPASDGQSGRTGRHQRLRRRPCGGHRRSTQRPSMASPGPGQRDRAGH